MLRRRAPFWLLLVGATIFLSLEPSLFLVVLALALSALTLTWIVLLARFLVFDALMGRAARTHEDTPPSQQ